MTTAPEIFSMWLSTHVSPELRPLGFMKTGANFHLRGDGAWGVINFQKSPWGSRDETIFYVNVAVALDRLLELQGRDPAKRPPHHVANWRNRLEHLVPHPLPNSWRIVADTDLDALTRDVMPSLIEFAIPAIRARLSKKLFVAEYRVADRRDWWMPPLDQVLRTLAVKPEDRVEGDEKG